MNWIEITKHILWALIFGLAIALGIWTLGATFRTLIKSKTALTIIRLLALVSLILAAFTYFPKWFGSN